MFRFIYFLIIEAEAFYQRQLETESFSFLRNWTELESCFIFVTP